MTAVAPSVEHVDPPHTGNTGAHTIPLALIRRTRNVRRTLGDLTSLRASIRRAGLLEEVLVRPLPEDDWGDGCKFELVAGFRRCAAAEAEGFTRVAANVRWMSAQDALEAQMTENLERQALLPSEEGAGFAALAEMGRSQHEIAAMFGCHQSHVSRLITIATKLPEAARAAVDAGSIAQQQAVKLAGLPPEDIDRLFADGRIPEEHQIRAAFHRKASREAAEVRSALTTEQSYRFGETRDRPATPGQDETPAEIDARHAAEGERIRARQAEEARLKEMAAADELRRLEYATALVAARARPVDAIAYAAAVLPAQEECATSTVVKLLGLDWDLDNLADPLAAWTADPEHPERAPHVVYACALEVGLSCVEHLTAWDLEHWPVHARVRRVTLDHLAGLGYELSPLEAEWRATSVDADGQLVVAGDGAEREQPNPPEQPAAEDGPVGVETSPATEAADLEMAAEATDTPTGGDLNLLAQSVCQALVVACEHSAKAIPWPSVKGPFLVWQDEEDGTDADRAAAQAVCVALVAHVKHGGAVPWPEVEAALAAWTAARP